MDENRRDEPPDLPFADLFVASCADRQVRLAGIFPRQKLCEAERAIDRFDFVAEAAEQRDGDADDDQRHRDRHPLHRRPPPVVAYVDHLLACQRFLLFRFFANLLGGAGYRDIFLCVGVFAVFVEFFTRDVELIFIEDPDDPFTVFRLDHRFDVERQQALGWVRMGRLAELETDFAGNDTSMWKSTDTRFRRMTLTAVGVAAWLSCMTPAGSADEKKPYGLQKRFPLTTSRVVGFPDPLPPFRAKRAYPEITFKQPLHVIKEPTSDRLFVVERYGKIFQITHDETLKTPKLIHDMKRTTYSLCFHPRYEKNGFIYVFSNGKSGEENRNRISRFTVGKANTIDPKSERIIIEWKSKGHDGHFVSFGPDGMLWISAGDGTVGMDPEMDGQDVSNLRGTMIRIDVDRPAKGKQYSVPKDNPFVGRKNTRPEIWAFGFRNPYRFAFDPENGKLWVADIGQDVWEMLYLVERGGNYGWSIMEGPEALNITRPKGPGPLIPPVISHPHSEMRSITGGFFYHGKQFPELRGAYLYGDYDTRRLWAMKYDYKAKKVLWKKEIARTKYRIISIGEDRDGEPLIAAFGGELLRLERTPASAKPRFPFPRKLSESGLFTSVKDHQLVPAAIPYSVNSPLWSDGAIKDRFMAVPGMEKVVYKASRAWQFPEGTVLVKTFSLETEPGNPKSRKRIETRFLTLHDNGEWAGYSYRWNAEQTDATLVESAGDDMRIAIRDAAAPGGKRLKKWRFPSRAECMVCHTREARYVLGVTTLQMNRDHDYGGILDNQLRTLNHIGLFKTKKPTKKNSHPSPFGDLAKLKKLPNPFDKSQPLDARARSYLHANCWHCHVVNGGGNAAMELHFSKSRKDAAIYDEKPRHITFGIKNPRLVAPGSPERSLILHRITSRGKGKMPPVGTNEIDKAGEKLLIEWVRALGNEKPKKTPKKRKQAARGREERRGVAGGG
eukprot:g8359.t1